MSQENVYNHLNPAIQQDPFSLDDCIDASVPPQGFIQMNALAPSGGDFKRPPRGPRSSETGEGGGGGGGERPRGPAPLADDAGSGSGGSGGSGEPVPGVPNPVFEGAVGEYVEIAFSSGAIVQRPESGSLPPGMYFSDGSGGSGGWAIRGVPTAIGRWEFVRCLDGVCRRFTIVVNNSWVEDEIVITVGDSVFIPLSVGRLTFYDGAGVVSGAMPPGLFVSDSVIVGVAEQVGIYRFVYCEGEACRRFLINVKSAMPTYTFGQIFPALVAYGNAIFARRSAWVMSGSPVGRDRLEGRTFLGYIGAGKRQASGREKDYLLLWGYRAVVSGLGYRPDLDSEYMLLSGDLSAADLSADDWLLVGATGSGTNQASQVVSVATLQTRIVRAGGGNGRRVVVDLAGLDVGVDS